MYVRDMMSSARLTSTQQKEIYRILKKKTELTKWLMDGAIRFTMIYWSDVGVSVESRVPSPTSRVQQAQKNQLNIDSNIDGIESCCKLLFAPLIDRSVQPMVECRITSGGLIENNNRDAMNALSEDLNVVRFKSACRQIT